MAAKIHPVILSRRNGHTSLAAIPNLLSETIPETGLGSQPVAANCAPGIRRENIRLAAHGCNEEHRFLVAEQPREIGIQPREIVLEPVARNTAPTVAAAASILSDEDKDALMQVLPSDHIIEDEVMFRRAGEKRRGSGRGRSPGNIRHRADTPETGYGYIAAGDGLGTYEGCFSVDSFVEKPDLPTAEGYVGTAVCSCGERVSFRMRCFQIRYPQKARVEGAERDLDFLRLVSEPFAALPSKSIDHAVMIEGRCCALRHWVERRL